MSFKRYLIVGFICLGAALVALAQQPAQATGSPEQTATVTAGTTGDAASSAQAADTLRNRAKQFYGLIMKGDRSAAAKMVAPESLGQYDQMDLRSMSSAVVEKVTVDGDKARVEVTRTFHSPVAMSLPWTDNWQLVNGEWYFTLPPQTYETPFGIVKPSDQPIDEKAVEQRMQREYKQVDVDQVVKQVDKYTREHPEALKGMEGPAATVTVQQQPPNTGTAPKNKSNKKPNKKSADGNVKQNSLTAPTTPPRQP
jgi:hypothetical protein